MPLIKAEKNYLLITTISSNPKYIYYNINPLGKKEQDCVIRAISLGTNTHYLDTLNLVDSNGYRYLCDNLNVECYKRLLREYFKLEELDGNGRTVSEIAQDYPDKTLIIRICGHLTCAIRGIIYDIWDCTNEEVDIYWIVEK